MIDDTHTRTTNTSTKNAAPTLRFTAENLRVGYGRRAILPALSFQIHAGEIWALFGPNGGGKSTLLRTLLGLQPAIRGQLQRFDTPLSAVPQRYAIDPLAPQRGLDVVRGGVGRGWTFMRPWLRAEERAAVQRAAEDTQSLDLLKRPFAALSEGQKQRLLIARALASQPALLTLDEPTSAMDPFHEHAIFSLLQHIAHHRQLAILVASHHMHALIESASHAIYVDSQENVALAGTFAEVAAHPAVHARYGDLLSTLDAPHPSAEHTR